MHIIVPDRVVDGEQRWHAIGIVGTFTLLVVVHIYPMGEEANLARIIGVRKATPHECRRYEGDSP
jgi:uncharacterized DUF497 family protein